MKRWKKDAAALLGLLVLIGIDRVTKALAVAFLKGADAVPVIQGIFSLQYLENHGAAFGIFANTGWLLPIGTLVILFLLVLFYLRIPKTARYLFLRADCVLLVAGAVGNLVDRIRQGYVVDFFYFELIDFPIFNVADCYVVVAAVAVFFLVCFYYREEDFSFLKGKREVDGAWTTGESNDR